MFTHDWWFVPETQVPAGSPNVFEMGQSEHVDMALKAMLRLDTESSIPQSWYFGPVPAKVLKEARKRGAPEKDLEYLSRESNDPRTYMIVKYGWVRVSKGKMNMQELNQDTLDLIQKARLFWDTEKPEDYEHIDIDELVGDKIWSVSAKNLRRRGAEPAALKYTGSGVGAWRNPSLSQWKGRAWRGGEEQMSFPRGASAAALIRYEQEELGNDLCIPEDVIKVLKKAPADQLIWVTNTEQAAERYGEPIEVFLPEDTVILSCDDGDGGFLVLKNADKWLKNIGPFYRNPEESIPCGDCFRYAAQMGSEYPNATVKHGLVHPSHKKKPYWHAWIESHGLVHDWQTGKGVHAPMTVEEFEENFSPENVAEYEPYEALARSVREGNFGPWHEL